MANPRDVTDWLPNLLGPVDFEVDGVAASVPRRGKLNLIGLAVEDDPDNSRTNITGGGGSSTVADDIAKSVGTDIDRVRGFTGVPFDDTSDGAAAAEIGAVPVYDENGAASIKFRKPVPPGSYDPRAYGAKMDGVHDDLGAFNALIAAMPDEGGVIYIGEGVAWLSDTLHIYKPVILTGCGGRTRDFSGFEVAPGVPALSIDSPVIGPTSTGATGGWRVDKISLKSRILVHETATGAAGGWGIGNQFSAGATVRLGDCFVRASNASPTRFFRATAFTSPGATVGAFGGTVPSWSDTLGSTVTDSGIVWTTEAFPTVRQDSHAYVVGDRVYADKDNRYVFRCTAIAGGGVSDSSPPVQMVGGDSAGGVTLYDTFADGDVTWICELAAGIYVNAALGECQWLLIEGFTGYGIVNQGGVGMDVRGQTDADKNNFRDVFIENCGGGIAIAGFDANGCYIDGLFAISNGTRQPTPDIADAAGFTDLGAHGVHDRGLGQFISNSYFQLITGRPILKNGGGSTTILSTGQEVPMVSLSTVSSTVAIGGTILWTDDSAVTVVHGGGGRGLFETGKTFAGYDVRTTLSGVTGGGGPASGWYRFDISHPSDTANGWYYTYGWLTPSGWVGFQHGTQSPQNAYLLSTTQAGLGIGAGWLNFQTGYMFGDPNSVTPLFEGHTESIVNNRLRSALRKQGDHFKGITSDVKVLEDGYRATIWVANSAAAIEYSPWAIPASYVTPTTTPKNRDGFRQIWKCTTAGTTHTTTEPTWPSLPTPGVTTVTDGTGGTTVTWTFHGYAPAYEVDQRNSATAQSPYRTAASQTTTTATAVIHDGGIVDGIDLALPDYAITKVRDEVIVCRQGTAHGGSITVESTWVRNGGAPSQLGTTTITYNLVGSTLDATTVAHVANGNRIELQASPESADTLVWNVFRRHFEGRVSLGIDVPMTGYWRGNFTASPWPGTPSTGVSGVNSAREATNPPSVGAALNGFTPADFDGTNDELTLDGTLDTYAAANAFSGFALVNIDAISSNASLAIGNDCIITTKTSGYFAIGLRDNAGTKTVMAYAFDGGDKQVSETIVTGAWQLIQWKLDGSTIKVRVNSGSWQSTACGSIGSLANGVRVGADYQQVQFFDGRIEELSLDDTVWTDAKFDAKKAQINARYGLSL